MRPSQRSSKTVIIARMGKVFLVLTVVSVFSFVSFVFAQEAQQIKEKISDQEQKIQELEQEIAIYEKELVGIGEEKRTLESTVRELDVSRRKVSANINVEEQRIDSLEGQIGQLNVDISSTEATIKSLRSVLGGLLSQMNINEEQTFVEKLLRSESLDGIWEEIDSVEQVNIRLRGRVEELSRELDLLDETRKIFDEKRAERLSHQNTLVAQKRGLDITKSEKNNLLKTTNQKESSYQELLEEKRSAKKEFESALQELESALYYTLDPTRIPIAGKGVLAWPLADVFITQKFGNTAFAQSGAYSGNGHNGIDFRASVGTPVKASLSGTVVGTGNTDAHRGCYSYGKWVLIKHANGLSTLYAHLSHITVAEGSVVATGEIIGNSGNTGYATGPHLHFSVYVGDAVKLVRLGDVKKKTNCANAIVPVAPLNTYLNPMEYL
jgi:murein DD-endopeptidase MepM/ murein hydrolase activator NlpD